MIPSADTIQAVRSFNRFYTQQLGLLEPEWRLTTFSLAAVRLLFEINQARNVTAKELCERLQLDPGYASRLICRLQSSKLVSATRSSADARSVCLKLTARGRSVFAWLDELAERQVRDWLRPIELTEQRRLVQSMSAIRDLLNNPNEDRQGKCRLRPPQPGDFGWVIERHGALYAQEFGWDTRFEAIVAEIVADFMNRHYRQKREVTREHCWIAEWNGQRVGSVLLVKKSPTIAKLRLLLVEPAARGLGVGRQLVQSCVTFAEKTGYRKLILWTDHILIAARHLYESFGFRLVHEKPHSLFGKNLLGQTWSLALR